MNFSLPTSIFFNLAKEKPIVINKGNLYILGGNKSNNFFSFSGEKINISESDSLSFFENEYKNKNHSKIKDTLSKILKQRYDVKVTSSNNNFELIDFIVNKVFFEYDHYYDFNVAIDFNNKNRTIKNNYKLDVNINFSNVENKSIFESIVDNVFIDRNFVFKLSEVADKIHIKKSEDFIFLDNNYYLLQSTNHVLNSIEKNYQETLLNKLEKKELINNKNLAKKLESFEKQKKLKNVIDDLNRKGYYEENKKGIYKIDSKFIPYVSTDDEFVLYNHNSGKYFLLTKFRVGVDTLKYNGLYTIKGEPFVFEKKSHPFVYYDTDTSNWKYKINNLGFHECCFNGRFHVDSKYSPERKIASALKSGKSLLESGYISNVNPVHHLESPKFHEISNYEMRKRGLKAKNKR